MKKLLVKVVCVLFFKLWKVLSLAVEQFVLSVRNLHVVCLGKFRLATCLRQ